MTFSNRKEGLRYLVWGMLLVSALLYSCFFGSSVQCDAKEDNAGQNIEQNGGRESTGYEGSTEVTAYVSMEPEQFSDDSEDSKISAAEREKVKTGDNNEMIHLLYIVIGSFIAMICGILRLYVDNFKKKTCESGKE